jgi:hypothetical protein
VAGGFLQNGGRALGTPALTPQRSPRDIDWLSLSLICAWAEPLRASLYELGSRMMLAVAVIYASYMTSVKRTSLPFGILYGALVFREPGLATHLPAGFLMLAGVLLIALT